MSTPKGHYPLAISLTSKDMSKSVAFYRNVLGFELETIWPDADQPMWANLVLDRQSVMLGMAMTAEQLKTCSHGTPEQIAMFQRSAEEQAKNRFGVGVTTYVEVPDVDAFHERVKSKGGRPLTGPTTQFYGLRDFAIEDPDGYRLNFYTNVKLDSCQSCGMPLTDAKPGQMYCGYCTDQAGKLKPYETVFEGTVQGYFMGMKKMPRAEAEKAAREHLAKMPAWAARK
jgi:catechol 2,3-dioxygenase-like lactoylglutathione lyase family enzyme